METTSTGCRLSRSCTNPCCWYTHPHPTITTAPIVILCGTQTRSFIHVHSTRAPSTLFRYCIKVLSRVYDYSLKTEDLLDLTNGNRQIALITVVSLLEDGETYTTELAQRQGSQPGQVRLALPPPFRRQKKYDRM